MDAVTGALVAAVVGWVSIIAVVRLPAPRWNLDAAAVRRAGGFAIATIALSVLGLELPLWSSLAVFVGALAVQALAVPRRAQGAD